MRIPEKISSHVRRLSHQVGMGPRIGNRAFVMRGYFPNRMASRLDQHEANLNALLAALVRQRPQGFWDVGANIGQTLLKVLGADPDARYVGFEPQIEPAAQIADFITRNRLRNAMIFPVGLGERDGCVTLYHRSPADEMATVAAEAAGMPGGFATTIMLRRGDAVFAELGAPGIGVLKIDTERTELAVLKGLQDTIGRCKPTIVLEMLPNFEGAQRDWLPDQVRAANDEMASATRHFLSQFGYGLSVIDGRGKATAVEDFNLNDRAGFVGAEYVASVGPLPPELL